MTESEKRLSRFKTKKKRPTSCNIGTLQDMPTDYRVQNFPRIGDKCDVSYPDGNYKGLINEKTCN